LKLFLRAIINMVLWNLAFLLMLRRMGGYPRLAMSCMMDVMGMEWSEYFLIVRLADECNVKDLDLPMKEEGFLFRFWRIWD